MNGRCFAAILSVACVLGLAVAPACSTALASDDERKQDTTAGDAGEASQSQTGKSQAQSARTPSTKSKARGPQSKTSAKTSKQAAGKAAKLEKATFGGGCFWCIEACYEGIPGVKSVVSGYAGGVDPHPVYEVVCTGITGHAEVVQVTYDPEVISYAKLLDIFWKSHDPTTLNRQGPDEGTQYRSIILFHNEDQRKAALESYKKLTAARVFPAPIVTELVPLKKFFPAERYHQDYYRKHPNVDYSQIYIAPKLQQLKYKLSLEAQAEAQSKDEKQPD